MVHIVKMSIRKCQASGHDFNLAMLVYSATAQSNKLSSSAEILNNRKFRALLPMHSVETAHQRDAVHDQMLMQQARQSAHYNKSARDLPPLHPNQPVYVQQDPNLLWKPAIVTEIPPDYKSHSYTVQTEDGSQPCCNRRFMKPNVVPQLQQEELETTPISAQTTPVVRPQCNAARLQRLFEEI